MRELYKLLDLLEALDIRSAGVGFVGGYRMQGEYVLKMLSVRDGMRL